MELLKIKSIKNTNTIQPVYDIHHNIDNKNFYDEHPNLIANNITISNCGRHAGGVIIADADELAQSMPIVGGKTFKDRLQEQIAEYSLDDDQFQLALHLIGSLDEAGYLRREIEAIVDDLAFTQNISTTKEELLDVLKIIQQFDPPGVGATDLRECLLLQIDRHSAKPISPNLSRIASAGRIVLCPKL